MAEWLPRGVVEGIKIPEMSRSLCAGSDGSEFG